MDALTLLPSDVLPQDLTMPAMVQAMRECEQTRGLSVLAHGLNVRDYFTDLVSHLRDGTPLRFDWRLPDWAGDPRLLNRLLPLDVLARYHTFHDCGKPYTRTVDEQGRVHFPNHAAVSAEAWRRVGGDEAVARLIAQDMDIHLLSGDGVAEFASRPEAASLLLTGLAEVHSNASMFGGIESTSFKIKNKHITRRGKQILALLT